MTDARTRAVDRAYEMIALFVGRYGALNEFWAVTRMAYIALINNARTTYDLELMYDDAERKAVFMGDQEWAQIFLSTKNARKIELAENGQR